MQAKFMPLDPALPELNQSEQASGERKGNLVSPASSSYAIISEQFKIFIIEMTGKQHIQSLWLI